MWGVYIFAGSAWSSMATLILITNYLRSAGYLEGVVSTEHFHIMGKLLLSFTVFWAYIAFGQYFLYWYANIPEETEYFLVRNTESWNTLSIAVPGRWALLHHLCAALPARGEDQPAPAFVHRRLGASACTWRTCTSW